MPAKRARVDNDSLQIWGIPVPPANKRNDGTHLYPISLNIWIASLTNSSLSMFESSYMVVPGRYTLLTALEANGGGVADADEEVVVVVMVLLANPLVSFPFENPLVAVCCCCGGCCDCGGAAENPFDARGEGVGKNSGGRNGGGPPPDDGGTPPLDEDDDKVSEGVVAS